MKHDLSENFSKKYKNSLSVWNKLGYGMGEAGSQFIWSLISSYLTLYYTDVVGASCRNFFYYAHSTNMGCSQ